MTADKPTNGLHIISNPTADHTTNSLHHMFLKMFNNVGSLIFLRWSIGRVSNGLNSGESSDQMTVYYCDGTATNIYYWQQNISSIAYLLNSSVVDQVDQVKRKNQTCNASLGGIVISCIVIQCNRIQCMFICMASLNLRSTVIPVV